MCQSLKRTNDDLAKNCVQLNETYKLARAWYRVK